MFDAVRRLLGSSPAPAPAGDWKKRGNELLAEGKLDGAIACYLKAAQAAPDDAAVRVNLGFAYLEQQAWDQAARWLADALRIDPRQHEALFLLARVRHATGDAAGALEAYAAATGIAPGFEIAAQERTQLLADLGQQALNTGRDGEARDWFRQWVVAAPQDPSAHAHLGLAWESLQDWREAELCYAAALQLQPGHPQTLFGMGNVLMHKAQPAAAADCYARVLEGMPDHVLSVANLAQALRDCKRLEAAEAAYRQWLALAPGECKAQLGLASVLSALARHDEAAAAYEQGLAAPPATAEVCLDQGHALVELGRPADAEQRFRQALALKPGYVDALANLGTVLQQMNRHQEAVAAFEQALSHDPGHARAHWNLALSRLVLGDLAAGWPEAEWRWQALRREPLRTGRPQWTGEQPLAGKTILVYAEQGLGDAIQFCRYAGLLAGRGAKVILTVPPALAGLLASLPAPCTITTSVNDLPPHDYVCPLLSLPLAFGTTLQSVPAAVPYLCAPPEALQAWRQRLGESDGKRVGIAWSGNAAHVNDRNRSIPLADLRLAMPGVELVSLQKEVRATDEAALRDARIAHFGEQLTDFQQTAALVAAMDLVISVDTSVAHLAGALGKPTWILLPFSPDWRWLLEDTGSPWYPTARLFRQRRAGDWEGVIRAVQLALRDFATR